MKNDVYMIRELIDATRYFRLKNILVDLVIIDEEKDALDLDNMCIVRSDDNKYYHLQSKYLPYFLTFYFLIFLKIIT